jgi:hypothetical protein
VCHLVDGLCRVVSRATCGAGVGAWVNSRRLMSRRDTRDSSLEVTRCLDETRSVLFGSRREYGREIGVQIAERNSYLRWTPPERPHRDPPKDPTSLVKTPGRFRKPA